MKRKGKKKILPTKVSFSLSRQGTDIALISHSFQCSMKLQPEGYFQTSFEVHLPPFAAARHEFSRSLHISNGNFMVLILHAAMQLHSLRTQMRLRLFPQEWLNQQREILGCNKRFFEFKVGREKKKLVFQEHYLNCDQIAQSLMVLSKKKLGGTYTNLMQSY